MHKQKKNLKRTPPQNQKIHQQKTNKNKIKTTNFNEILSKTLKNFTLLGYSWNLFNYLILPCGIFADYKVITGKMKTRGQEGKLIIKKRTENQMIFRPLNIISKLINYFEILPGTTTPPFKFFL